MLKYNIELTPGGFDREAIVQEGAGGADAVIIVSIVRDGRPPHSGPISYAITSADSVGYDGGDPADVPVTEMFQAAMFMAERVAHDEAAPLWQRQICSDMVERTHGVVTQRGGAHRV